MGPIPSIAQSDRQSSMQPNTRAREGFTEVAQRRASEVKQYANLWSQSTCAKVVSRQKGGGWGWTLIGKKKQNWRYKVFWDKKQQSNIKSRSE